MRVTGHPPLSIVTARSDPETTVWTTYLHASLWINVDLVDWSARRSGHLHLIRADADSGWRLVDLAGHPLQQHREVPAATPEEIAPLLSTALASWDLRFFRIAELGLVSELGEGRDDFRRRALGLLRPQVQARVDELSGENRRGLSWFRRSRKPDVEDARVRMAAILARLADSIEERAVADVAAAVSRAELGTLMVPDGVTLRPPRYRELMVSG